MKVKLKKSLEIPVEIRTFTDRVVATPLERIGEALSTFTWKYEKGDFYQWVPLFNHFDDFFYHHVRGRCDLNLKFPGVDKDNQTRDPPFPLANTLAVLKVTARILENCTNKHLYQSYEHLTDLLAASEQEVVIGALQALVAFLRKTHHSSVRFHGYPKLNSRLFDLCRGWGGKEEGLDLVSCVNEDELPLKNFLSRGTTLHFEFYAESRPEKDNVEMNEMAGAGQQVIHIRRLDKINELDHEILRQLVRKYRVPVDIRFRLLTQIKIAHGFGSLDGRRHLVLVRLLAFCVLFQSNPLHEEMLSFFLSEPEFMNELVGLVQSEDGIPLELRTFALRALAVQLVDRSRHAVVINAIGVGGQNGVLSVLLQDSINYITSPQNVMDKEPKYNASFVEALLSLVGALVSSSSGSVALSEAGFIPALLPLIQDPNPSHVSLVCTAVKILEAFMDFSSPASAMFRGLGGLTNMIQRLENEVMVVTKPGEPSESTAPPEVSDEEQLSLSSGPKQIPYIRRLLLKSLLRAIALASYAPTSGTGRRPDEADSQMLFACLRIMFRHSRDFGGALFALAASVVTDLIHHDPLCYRSLHDTGVPEAFLMAVREGVTPSSEAVCCVPNTLVALCLNAMGLELVQADHALDCLVAIFTSKKYLKALSGDTASILGAGIDELLRHVPALKDEGIDVVIAISQAICILGGDEELAAQHLQDQMDTSQPPSSLSDPDESGDVEMDSVGEADRDGTLPGPSQDIPESPSSLESVTLVPQQRKVPIPQEVWDRSKEKGIDPTLPECISHATKMLESLLANQETSRRVVELGGIDLLLRMYRLPRMPPAFGSSSHSHTMLQIFRAITPHHQLTLPGKVKDALAVQLEVAIDAAKVAGDCCVPTMEPGQRDHYVRLIASAGGLTGIAAMVARSAMPMLVEICRGDPSLLAKLGQLERMVMTQLAEADHWKEIRDKEKREKEKSSLGDNDVSTSASSPSADITMAGTEDVDIGDVGLNVVRDVEADGEPNGDGDGDQMDMESVEMLRGGSAQRLEVSRVPDTSNIYGMRGRKKKSQEDVAYDVLQHFVVTVRSFYMAVAKSIHTPARRREESFSQPTMSMRAATLGLVLVLKNNLDHDAVSVVRNPDKNPEEDAQYFVRKSQHLMRLVEEVMTVLFDNRRHYCHTLILNYFVAVGGMDSLSRRFQEAIGMLWEVVEYDQKKKSGDFTNIASSDRGNQPASNTAGHSFGRGSTFVESVNHLANLISGDASPVRVVEGLALSLLGLLEQLTNPRLLCQSMQSATLMTVPLPNSSAASEETPASSETDAETFINYLQALVLGVVMPVWMDPLLPFSSPLVASSIISILNSCSDGPGSLATALRRSGPIRHPGMTRLPPVPDQEMVQRISEMGFTTSMAEEALRRVGHNSMELAMEWLITHPERFGNSGPEATPVADTNTPVPTGTPTPNIREENQQSTEDQVLAQALAASLSEIRTGEVSGPSSAAKATAADDTKLQVPKPVDLVGRAVAVLEKMPVAAFSITDLLITLCNRNEGEDRGLVLMYLISNLKEDGSAAAAVKLNPSRLNARAHLLAVLLSESPQCREAAAEKGVIEVVLEILEAWGAENCSQLQTPHGNTSRCEAEARGDSTHEIPMWVEALLLIIDIMAQTQPKHPAKSPPPAAGSSIGPSPNGQSSATQDVPATVGSGLELLLLTWQPCGLLTPSEHDSALQVCIHILKHLHAYGNTYKVTSSLGVDHIARPDPAATTQAVLQVLTRLTVCHKGALEVLRSGSVDLLLTLPASCLLPKHEVHISTILKHILEDSGTLQSYMEAEIKNLLTSRNRHSSGPTISQISQNSNPTSTMPVRTFLQSMANVVNRNPKIFMEAVSSTCSLEVGSGNNGRQSITLKKMKGSEGKDAKEGHPKPKTGKKVVPMSFVDVIDKLLSVVYKFNPAVAEKQSQEERKASKKEDLVPVRTAAEGSQMGGSGRGSSDSDPFLEMTQWLINERMAHPGPSERLAASHLLKAGGAAASLSREGRANSQDIIMQSTILRMLSDFCLMYTSTVGVLLKRDTEMSLKDMDTPSSACLLKYILHNHLVFSSQPPPLRPVVSEEASRFLQAICIRSTEGRRRIVTEVVNTINKAIDGTGPVVPTSFNMPFASKEGLPSGAKIKAFVDLIGSLLSASSGSQSENRSTQTSGLTVEMIRSMREVGVVSALTRVLKLVEMDHPEAPKAINSIIKPLEVLTRTIPAQTKRSGIPGVGNQTAADSCIEPVALRGSHESNPNRDGGTGILQGSGEEAVNYVTEAGPEAMAVAGQMMEDVMEDFVETLRDIIDDDGSPLDRDDDDEMDEDVDRLGDSRHGSIGNSMDAADALRDALEDAGNGDDDDQEEDNDEDLDHDNTDQGEGDHVVVDEVDEDESEDMGHEDDGDSERSRSPGGVLDEEEEDIEDEEEEEDGEEGSADMELDNGEDWDDTDSREYVEALDRIEGELRGEASNLARGYVRLQPHLRSMFGNLLGNFVGLGADMRIDRRSFRYRPPRFDRSNTTMLPFHPSTGAAQHRLLMRPPAATPNASSSRSIGTLGEALIDAGTGGNDNGLGWRRIAFPSGMGGELVNSLPESGDNGLVSFQMEDHVRPLRRMGGVGGWQLMTGLYPNPAIGMDYRSGREASRNASSGPSSWLSGLQGTLEQHIVDLLRDVSPPENPSAEPTQPGDGAGALADRLQPNMVVGVEPESPQAVRPHHRADRDGMVTTVNVQNDNGDQSPVTPSLAAHSPAVEDSGLHNRMAESHEGNSADEADMGHGPPESSPGAAVEALTPEFVQNAIQNTIEALAGLSGPPHPHNSEQPGTSVRDQEGGISEDHPMHPTDEQDDEDEEMADLVPDQIEQHNPSEAAAMNPGPSPDGRNADEDGRSAQAIASAEASSDPAGASLDPEIMERAQASGIDPTFLQALPRNLQIEVLSQHGVSVSTLVNSGGARAGASPGTADAAVNPSGTDAGQPDQVDPEFLAALPPDIREEVLETQRLREQRREVERQLTQGGPDDVANVVASLPEDIREEVLLYSGPDVLANLPPDLIAEGQRLRDRHLRHVALDHEDSMARNFLFRRIRQDMGQVNPRGGYRSPSTGYGSRKEKRDEMEGPPSLDEPALVTLVELLRLSQPIHKGHLQKLFLNLCSRSETRCIILQLLLQKLTESSRIVAEFEDVSPNSSRMFLSVDMDEEVPMRMDLGSSSTPVPAKQLQGTPPVVTRRILDLLSYLARHQNSKVAEVFLDFEVSLPRDSFASSGPMETGKFPASDSKVVCSALEVLLQMLGQPLCQRSVSALEQNLHLLEVVMQCATTKVASSERATTRKSQTRRRRVDDGSMVEEDAGADTGPPERVSGAQRQGPSGNMDSSTSQREESRAETSANGESSSGIASTSNVDQATRSLKEIPESLLQWLPGLLGRRGLSDRAYRTCASLMKLLVEAAPRHKVFMVLELEKQASNLTQSLVETLHRIGLDRMDGSSTMANTVGTTGSLVRRILHAIESLIKVKQGKQSEPAPDMSFMINQVAMKLDPLWSSLSIVIAEIEKQIQDSAETQTDANATAKILPPVAAYILPLVESFFILCSAQECLPSSTSDSPGEPTADEKNNSDLEARTSAVPSDTQVADNSQPLMKFAEAHRVMLNAFLRQTPTLLEESLSPLLRAPRLIDFDNKRLYFKSKVRSEERHYGTLRINVRREHVFEDSFHQLRHRSPEELRCKLSVQFTGEEGIDAGGVSREWYQVMSREIFNPNLALFVSVPEGSATSQPNPNSVIQNDRGVNHLDFFKFVGRILGKALYDGQLVDVHFTRSFYKHMLNLELTYEDLEAVDPDYYKQMKWTLQNDITDVLDETFAAEVDFFGRKEVVELKSEGAKVKVTEENKKEYVNLMTKHKMTTAIRDQIKSFQEGFWELVPKELIAIFNDHELELLISGLPEVDVADLKANTEYSGYTAVSPVIQWFWEVVEEMGKEELALLLQFVTGTSKVPLEGFANLQGISGPQKFQIHKSYAKTNRLPSAHTCFNQLDLPEYPSKDKLKDRLLVAVHEGREGFGFG